MSDLSVKSANTAIDPDQLLALCHHIHENLDRLEASIRLVQLRLTGLHYAASAGNGDKESPQQQLAGGSTPTKCLGDLADLCQLGHVLVRQLDELQAKLAREEARTSVSFHIASQQLAFFTSEWYDNLTPKFRRTLEMADRFQLTGSGSKPPGVSGRSWFGTSWTKLGKQQQPQQQKMGELESRPAEPRGATSTEVRVRDGLVRLRQSMGENERLIASIASNLDYTKATIEAIYQSLRSTRVNLELGDQNALESIQVVRSSERTKLWLTLGCALVLLVIIFITFRLVGIL